MKSGPSPEEKRRLVRLVLLLVILLATVYALLDLANRLEDARPKEDGDLSAEETAG